MGQQGKASSFANNLEGIAALGAFCQAHQADLVAMEATGGYEQQAFALLSEQGLPVAILNPRAVRQFAQSMGSLEKTDAIVSVAQISAAILGNFSTREFVLVDLAPGPIPDCLYGRVLSYIGVTGIVNGAPRTALVVELDDAALSAIAMAWVHHLAARIMPYLRPPDDSVSFLERLHALQDTRIG